MKDVTKDVLTQYRKQLELTYGVKPTIESRLLSELQFTKSGNWDKHVFDYSAVQGVADWYSSDAMSLIAVQSDGVIINGNCRLSMLRSIDETISVYVAVYDVKTGSDEWKAIAKNQTVGSVKKIGLARKLVNLSKTDRQLWIAENLSTVLSVFNQHNGAMSSKERVIEGKAQVHNFARPDLITQLKKAKAIMAERLKGFLQGLDVVAGVDDAVQEYFGYGTKARIDGAFYQSQPGEFYDPDKSLIFEEKFTAYCTLKLAGGEYQPEQPKLIEVLKAEQAVAVQQLLGTLTTEQLIQVASSLKLDKINKLLEC